MIPVIKNLGFKNTRKPRASGDDPVDLEAEVVDTR